MNAFDPGSFRDRSSRVYTVDGRILRGLDAEALAHQQALAETRFFREAIAAGQLVGTKLLAAEDNPLPPEERARWAGFLEHDRVPFISYPYEWTFSMLRAAALLQLDLLLAALAEDFTLKDASAYNIQFQGQRPVFIDLGSFTPLQPGEPWVGYRQFCELFLYPLLLQAYKDVPMQPLLRASIDGVPVQTASRLFRGRDVWRKGVGSHVRLQALFQRRYDQSESNVRSDLKSAGFSKELILANVRKMKRLVEGLGWAQDQSEWAGYGECHNYSAEDHTRKEDFVRRCVGQQALGTVWDIGCNQGQFARIAAESANLVLAMDVDHLSVERMFLSKDLPANVHPLVQNLVDPSPAWGWRHQERRELADRSTPDAVLALALIHHIVISNHIPLDDFVDWLAGLTPRLLIEFVGRDDDKVQTLLRNKAEAYADYDQSRLEEALGRHYRIEDRLALRDGRRTLYWCVRDA